jgi:hypothetical protein
MEATIQSCIYLNGDPIPIVTHLELNQVLALVLDAEEAGRVTGTDPFVRLGDAVAIRTRFIAAVGVSQQDDDEDE